MMRGIDFVKMFQFQNLNFHKRCPRDAAAKVLGCNIAVSEFLLKLCYYIHFWTTILEKGIKPLIPTAIGVIVPLQY